MHLPLDVLAGGMQLWDQSEIKKKMHVNYGKMLFYPDSSYKKRQLFNSIQINGFPIAWNKTTAGQHQRKQYFIQNLKSMHPSHF